MAARRRPLALAQADDRVHARYISCSLVLLGRAVSLNADPTLSKEESKETIEGINRVLAVLCPLCFVC